MQWQRTNIPIPKGKSQSIARKSWTKVRLKPSRENTNSYSSTWGIQGSGRSNLCSTKFGQPCAFSSTVHSTHSLSLGPVPLHACNFPQLTSHGFSISSIPWCLPSQHPSVAWQGFLVWTPALPHITWPQKLPGTVRQESIKPSILYLSCLQKQSHMDDAAKFCYQLQTDLAPLYQCMALAAVGPHADSGEPLFFLIGQRNPLDSFSIEVAFSP